MLKRLLIVMMVLNLASCRQVADIPSNLLSNENNIKITVDLNADGTINPGMGNQRAQPVKTCLFVVKSEYWTPDSVSDGIPCDDQIQSNEIIDSRSLMVSPNEKYHVEFDLVYNKKDNTPIWLLVGSNFQQINDFKPIDRAQIQKKNKKVFIPVKITRNEIQIGKAVSKSKKSDGKTKNSDNIVVF